MSRRGIAWRVGPGAALARVVAVAPAVTVLALAAAPAAVAPPAPVAATRAMPGSEPAASAAPVELLAQAQEEDQVHVVVDRFTPRVPSPDTTLRLSGQLINRSDRTVREPGVRIRISERPIWNRSLMDRVIDPDFWFDAPVDGTRVEVADRIEPGGEVEWTLEVPFETLDRHMGGESGVYTMAVEVRERESDRVGLVETYLPWMPSDRIEPTKLALVWPVLDRPWRVANDWYIDDRLADALEPTGRLQRLVTIAGQSSDETPVTWVVEPDLLQSVAAMRDGYQVMDGGRRRPVAASAEATQWVDALKEATAGPAAEVVSLPYAQPDLNALSRAGRRTDIALAATWARDYPERLLERPVRTDVAWPAEGMADRNTVEALSEVGRDTVLLNDQTLPPRETLDFTPSARASLDTGDDTTDVLLTDSTITELIQEDTSDPGDPVLVSQRILAETAMITMEKPIWSRTLVVAPPKVWNPHPEVATSLIRDLLTAPWIEPVSLDAALAYEEHTATRRSLTYPDETRERELSPAALDSARELHEQVNLVTGVLTIPDRLTDEYLPAILRATSAAWRERGPQSREFSATISDNLGNVQQAVRIVSEGSVTLSSKRGRIPVTVINNLKQAVTVRVSMRPRIAGRLTVEKPRLVSIEAGHRATVGITADSVANGMVIVDVELLTQAGKRYGATRPIRVNVTNYGTLGLFIVGGATALLFGSAAFRLFRRVRAARHPDRGGGEADTERGGDSGGDGLVYPGFEGGHGTEPDARS